MCNPLGVKVLPPDCRPRVPNPHQVETYRCQIRQNFLPCAVEGRGKKAVEVLSGSGQNSRTQKAVDRPRIRCRRSDIAESPGNIVSPRWRQERRQEARKAKGHLNSGDHFSKA